MPFTNFTDQGLLELLLGDQAFTIPGTLYFALSSTAPSQVKGGAAPFWNFTEPSGNAYARVAVVNNATNFGPVTSEPTNGYTIQNNVVVTFPQSTGAWSSGSALGYFGLFDAATNGNLILYGTCSPAQSVGAANITISFAIGAMTATLN